MLYDFFFGWFYELGALDVLGLSVLILFMVFVRLFVTGSPKKRKRRVKKDKKEVDTENKDNGSNVSESDIKIPNL